VRTVTLKGGKYMRVCIDNAGKVHKGHVKVKESPVAEAARERGN
jgi:hypothetical protein